MKFEIKNRWSGEVLFSLETESFKLCVITAIKSGANLTRAKNSEIILARTSIVPEEGAFVGYKKLANDVVAKLVIPHDAKRLNAYGSRKCRAEKVFVLEGEGYDKYTGKTKYTPDTLVIPDSFNEDRREECSHGIHFFITRAEAKNY